MQTTFGQGSRPFFDMFSTLGGPGGWLLIGAIVFWLSGSKAGLRVAFSTAIATITNEILKRLFALPRPYYVNDEVQAMKASSGLGMPSGHAQGVAANWGATAHWNRGAINPTSSAHRCTNVLLGVPTLFALLLVAELQFTELIGEVLADSLLVLLLPPFVGIVLPSLTGRIFHPKKDSFNRIDS